MICLFLYTRYKLHRVDGEYKPEVAVSLKGQLRLITADRLKSVSVFLEPGDSIFNQCYLFLPLNLCTWYYGQADIAECYRAVFVFFAVVAAYIQGY